MSKKHLFALIVALQLWGTAFPALKYAVNTVPPFTIIFYRFLFAFILLLPIFALKFKENFKVMKDNKKLFLLGILNFVGIAVQLTGIKYTTSTKSVILTQTLIVVVPVLAYFFLRELLNVRKVAGIILSLVGAVILSTSLRFDGLLEKGTVVGDVLVLGSVVVWGFFIILTRKYTREFSGFMMLFPSITATVLLAFPTAALTGNLPVNTTGLLVSLYLAVFCTIIPTLLFNYALRELDAVTSTVIGPVEIISSTILAYFFLGETLTPVELSGGLLIILSVYIVAVKKRRRKL
ncbi:MAG: DMT family transporter [bacterium]|nr:DMT family transporter [bacterium]